MLFFISNYYLFFTLSSKNISRMHARLERLLIPYLCYPLIIWICNNIFYLFFKINRFQRLLSIKDLIIQLLFGRKFMVVQWFNFNLIFLTFIFFIIALIFNTKFMFFIKLLVIFSYYLLYSNYSYSFFFHYKENILGSVAYLVESIPLGGNALFLSSIELIKRLEKNRKETLFFFSLSLYFLIKYPVFIPIMGNNNKGIIQNIISFFLFFLFHLIPFRDITSINFATIIKIITSYTQGIFCLHLIVFFYLNKIRFQINSFFYCLIIYLVSYLISFLGLKIFSKTKLKYLFI